MDSPIGNLTSQLFANVYLDRFDHFVTEVLRAPYLRYVDDFALFADDATRLADWRGRAAAFLARRRLSLHPEKTGREADGGAGDVLGSSCGWAASGGCRRATFAAFATACVGCGTAGWQVRCRERRWSSEFAPGWRTRRTPTRGGCAVPSSGTGGSHRAGLSVPGA